MENSIVVPAKPTDDGVVFCDIIIRLFNSHFAEVLDTLSSRFAHLKGDGSDNEKEFQGLRAKVLRSGNNKIRQLPELISEFNVTRIMDTVVERTLVATPYVMPTGQGE